MVDTAVFMQLRNIRLAMQIVKLQVKAKFQTSVLVLEVDIVFFLPQQEKQPSPKVSEGCVLEA